MARQHLACIPAHRLWRHAKAAQEGFAQVAAVAEARLPRHHVEGPMEAVDVTRVDRNDVNHVVSVMYRSCLSPNDKERTILDSTFRQRTK